MMSKERLEKNREYKKKYKKKLLEQAKEYYQRNKEKKLAYQAQYKKKNKENISRKEAIKRLNDESRFEKNNKKHYEWSKNKRHHINEWQRQWYQKNKEKRRAHVVLHRALRAGKVMRPENCSECKKNCKPDGHHEDYSKPLDVIWICRACHSRKSPRTVIR